uniref:Solute carrier family 2, facilitated glucose transporter member 5 n=1 Tax=Mastacembelus armatus TaxID=205130 RepID=A0A3Q3MYE3_9TELE
METLLHQLTHGNALILIIILGIGGSFQNGYHITSLSSPSPYIQRFINSSWYDRYEEPPPPQTVTTIWSLIVSMYAVGGLFGTVSVKFISGMVGRKKTMICNSCIAIAAAGIMMASKGAKSYEMIIAARILNGYSAGLGMCTHLMYLGEISPRNIRGAVTLTSATFLSLGRLSGRFFGLSEILGCEELWNIVLCVPAFFSLVQVIALPFLPDAPRYLFIEKGDDKACRRALQSLWGQGDYKQEMDDMLAEQVAIEAAPPKSPLKLLRDSTVRWQLITMSLIYCCNQLSGLSTISTFSFDIFLKAGIPRDKIRYVTLGLGLSEIITSVLCGLLIEHTGRRPLFWICYGVMSASWVLVTVTLNLEVSSYWVPYVAACLINLFILFCGGPVGATATLNSEIFIQSHRLAALVLMGIQRWLVVAMLGLVFPFLIRINRIFFICLYVILYSITVCGKSFLEKRRLETKL